MAETPASKSYDVLRRASKNRAVQVGACATALYVVLQGVHPFGMGSQVDQDKSHIHASVKKGGIQPLDLTARSIMFAGVNGNVRTQDSLTVPTNLWGGKKKVLIPGSGYSAAIKGEARTITFVPGDASTISRNNKKVTIDPTKIEFLTDFLEDKTLVTDSLPLGTSLGSGESQIIRAGSGGLVSSLANKVSTEQAHLNQYLVAQTANTVQADCGSESWDQTKESVVLAYDIDAQEHGLSKPTVVWLPGGPSFAGPYPNVTAPTNLHESKIQDSVCQVAANALEIAHDFTIYHPTQLTPVVEAAGN